MKNRIYGYARVSSADQNLDRQLDALERFPVQTNLIYADKASGKDFRRPQYRRLLRRLREGDVLVIKSIDRLGRDYREVIDEWRRLTTDKRVAIVVLDMPLLDTREQPNGITGTFIADLVLQVLSYVAQVERENIKAAPGGGYRVGASAGCEIWGDRRSNVRMATAMSSNHLKEVRLRDKRPQCFLNVSASTFDRWRRADANGYDRSPSARPL